MRAVTLADKIPYYTTLAASHAAAQAMKAAREGELGVRSLQGSSPPPPAPSPPSAASPSSTTRSP
jgi:hypothetical protein